MKSHLLLWWKAAPPTLTSLRKQHQHLKNVTQGWLGQRRYLHEKLGNVPPLSSALRRAAIDGNWRAEISLPKAGNVSFLPTNYERWHAEPWPLLEHIFVWCTKNWVRWTRLSQKQIDEIRWFRSTTPCVVGQCVLWPQQLCACKSHGDSSYNKQLDVVSHWISTQQNWGCKNNWANVSNR